MRLPAHSLLSLSSMIGSNEPCRRSVLTNQSKLVFLQPIRYNRDWTCAPFPALGTRFTFPALDTRFIFSRAWHTVASANRDLMHACFPALGICFTFACAWHPFRLCPRLAHSCTFFLSWQNVYVYCTWLHLHVFPRLALVKYLPTVGTRLHIFPRLAKFIPCPRLPPVAHFPHRNGWMFSRAWHGVHVFPWSSDWYLCLSSLARCDDSHKKAALPLRYM